jgi:hypothetical protein
LRNCLAFFLDRRSAHGANIVHLEPLCYTILVIHVLARELRNLLLFSEVIVADGTKVRFLTRSVLEFFEVGKSLLGGRWGAVVFWHSSKEVLEKLVEAHKAIRKKIDRIEKYSDSAGSWDVVRFVGMLRVRMSMVES